VKAENTNMNPNTDDVAPVASASQAPEIFPFKISLPQFGDLERDQSRQKGGRDSEIWLGLHGTGNKYYI